MVYHWAEGEDVPWRLVTSLEAGFKVVCHYRRRMWIEELFGDFQGGGFCLDQSRICRRGCLARLVLGLSLAYVWLVAVASYVVKRGWRRLIDRTDRRDRSCFALGQRWIQRCLTNARPPHMCLFSYF